VYSINNMRELGQFSMLAHHPDDVNPPGEGKEAELARLRAMEVPGAIPAGTIMNKDLKVSDRLSWIPLALPYMNQRRQDTSAIVSGLDRMAAWQSEVNAPLSQTIIRSLIPTAIDFKAQPSQPAPTYYFGSGGIGPNGAMAEASDPMAGCFRYDKETPFGAIGDGLRESILFIESASKPSPWLQGGESTIRMFDVSKPIFGPEGQFGGVHARFSVFGYADGSAGVLTDRTDKSVIRSLMTINGGKTEPLAGE
ncbi:MAG: hypothetical protein U0798_16260, partial [Gemmataceae bacterium]